MKRLNSNPWFIIALSLFLLGLPGCKSEGYERPPAEHDLGPVKDLLLPTQLIRSRAMLVSFDEHGWRTMSTRCSNDGCDLTYQENNFLCSCCRSVFDHQGHVLKEPAKNNLPWFKMLYDSGHLYADAGKKTNEEDRFAMPELMEAVAKYRARALEQGKPEGRKIPEVLLGHKDPQAGPMFLDSHPDQLFEAQMGITSSSSSGRRKRDGKVLPPR